MKQIIYYFYSQENTIEIFNSNIKILDYKETIISEISSEIQ